MPLSHSSLITPCLWFDHEGEEAAKFYTSIFPDSEIGQVSYYTEAGHDHHHQPAGKVLTVNFTLSGTPFLALNGGSPDPNPDSNLNFKFTEAISFQIDCKDQDEVDYYWSKLLEGGGKEGHCGWLKDRFGVSWQVVPVQLKEWLGGKGNGEGGKRAMERMMGMVKLNIEGLRKAYEGTG
ncbi:hypothetical protein EPUS_03935 [Endocarpon pusillum Z07020]|uniref:PhnB-like domain-containing protein n=1 Tax=Endocarpon pusillum (strain Z07020 / HMAS-L-300199) TaxID=1263415 RepID=U1GAF4_ENDPU|nr:uncharacterized protein EPUS_03935 [Endocarpon pusillum Z07020]ERF74497.1 hypothetical protein EPUS_03935 [Endocarpon pusillum Z07020]